MNSAGQHEKDDALFDSEAAARASFLKMTPRKRRMIRLFELVLHPIVSLVESLRTRPASSHDVCESILVIEYWNIGDIVNVLPFLSCLRAGYPNAQISLLANPAMSPVLAGQNLLDEIIPFTTPWSRHFSRWRKYNPFSLDWFSLFRSLLSLRRRKFHMVLTGRMDIRDNFLAWLIGARRRVGYGFAGGAFLLTDVVTPDLSRPHRSKIWLQLLRHLGKPILTETPQLLLTQEEKSFAETFLRDHRISESECIVGVHAGARIPARRWGAQNFASVASRIAAESDVRILWFVDPKEKEATECPSAGFVPVCLPFRQFLAVLARCHLVLCNDSGPMHLATALGVPVVAVFGPMQPAWFGPMGENNRVVIRQEFWCRPCFDYCIFDQPYCLRAISPDEVHTAASRSLAQILPGVAGRIARR